MERINKLVIVSASEAFNLIANEQDIEKLRGISLRLLDAYIDKRVPMVLDKSGKAIN